jgi:transcriptional regulator with XRE-family HTH domain
MNLAERLRELRTQNGKRLKDVADAAGISVPYLSDLERGRTNPSMDTLQALARAYEISMQDLIAPVDFGGPSSSGPLPPGLAELAADPVLGPRLGPDWIASLSRIELRGRRPRTKEDWYEVFLHLRRVIPGDQP